jgi:hypothetical protein
MSGMSEGTRKRATRASARGGDDRPRSAGPALARGPRDVQPIAAIRTRQVEAAPARALAAGPECWPL